MPLLMKGHTWRDYARKMTYPCIVEAKYDEIRCHVVVHGFNVMFRSYADKPLANMQEFEGAFIALAQTTGMFEFDTGFEVNGNFNDSYRWVRSTKGIPEDLVHAPRRFLLYDFPCSTEPYHARVLGRLIVKAVWDEYPSTAQLHVPEGCLCVSDNEVVSAYQKYISEGYEGAMVKSREHTYQRKRSYDWLKMKPEEEADGEIIEINQAYASVDDIERSVRVGDALGRAGSVRVVMLDGSVADPHGIRHDLGTDMIQNPQAYIGQWCTFKYMERDRQGGYRHPRFYRLREEK